MYGVFANKLWESFDDNRIDRLDLCLYQSTKVFVAKRRVDSDRSVFAVNRELYWRRVDIPAGWFCCIVTVRKRERGARRNGCDGTIVIVENFYRQGLGFEDERN